MIKLNGKEIVTEKFSNNELRVKDIIKSAKGSNNVIELKFQSDEDLIVLMFVKKRLDELEVQSMLFVWYMPYSRMDKEINGDLFTLRYICDFISSLSFETVYIVDPHSEVTTNELIASCEFNDVDTSFEAIYPVCYWLPIIIEDIGFTENDYYIFSQKGMATYECKDNINMCVMEKKYDPITGALIHVEIKAENINPGSKCIIIDNLCSEGKTYELAANKLKELGASEVYLVVTHCEETIFNGKLLEDDSPIEMIYTSTSMMSQEHPKICYMDINISDYI